jgi:hypothetical protein
MCQGSPRSAGLARTDGTTQVLLQDSRDRRADGRPRHESGRVHTTDDRHVWCQMGYEKWEISSGILRPTGEEDLGPDQAGW